MKESILPHVSKRTLGFKKVANLVENGICEVRLMLDRVVLFFLKRM